MVIRTYIDKDNTIIKDTTINTGRNEIADGLNNGHISFEINHTLSGEKVEFYK